jgi:hypothetical protein
MSRMLRSVSFAFSGFRGKYMQHERDILRAMPAPPLGDLFDSLIDHAVYDGNGRPAYPLAHHHEMHIARLRSSRIETRLVNIAQHVKLSSSAAAS